jgi:hypothetical protein
VTVATGQIHELNEAVATKDLDGFVNRMQPDAVWDHNPGSGSTEEGEYQGRERIRKLFDRILEGWEYMRPVATEIREVEPGVFLVSGELHSKHLATDNEIVEPYEQRLEIREGLMSRCRMLLGSSARE